MEFVWTEHNVEYLGKHGILPQEAEQIIEYARPPYPQMIGNDKRMVIGRLSDGRYAQAIYVPSRLVVDAVYLIHARELTDPEKRRFRRRIR